jgi:hypothetical protein
MSLRKTLQIGFLLLPVFSFGQLRIPRDTLLKIYDRQTIIYLNSGVMQDGQMQKRMLFSNPLKKTLRTDSIAYKLFQKSNWQLVGGGFLVGMSVLPITIGVSNLKGNSAISQTEATSLTLGGALAFGLGVWMTNKGTNGFHEATWLYNRNAILRGLHQYNDSASQAQVTRSYDQNSIRRTNFGFYHNGRYEMMGSFGFHDPLKDRLRPNIAAYSLYQRGNLYRTTGTALTYASVFASLYAFSKILNPSQFTANTLRETLTISLVSTAASLLGSTLIVNGENEIQKAVWFYNRDAFVNGVF